MQMQSRISQPSLKYSSLLINPMLSTKVLRATAAKSKSPILRISISNRRSAYPDNIQILFVESKVILFMF